MKKVLSLILTLSMLLSMATVVGTSVAAETDVYNITFDKLDEVASTNTFCELSSDVRIGTKGNSLCFKESNMTCTEYLTNDSARRTYPSISVTALTEGLIPYPYGLILPPRSI